MIRVGVGTSKVMPSGASTMTGWEKPEGQLERGRALGVGPVADADDLELLGEALGDPGHHVGDEGAGQAVQGPVPTLVVGPGHDQHVALLA